MIGSCVVAGPLKDRNHCNRKRVVSGTNCDSNNITTLDTHMVDVNYVIGKSNAENISPSSHLATAPACSNIQPKEIESSSNSTSKDAINMVVTDLQDNIMHVDMKPAASLTINNAPGVVITKTDNDIGSMQEGKMQASLDDIHINNIETTAKSLSDVAPPLKTRRKTTTSNSAMTNVNNSTKAPQK